MVDHDKNRIIAFRSGKVGNKIHSDERKRACIKGLDRLQRWVGGVTVDLVLLTDSAAVHIIFDKRRQARPPIVLPDKFLCPEVTRMAGGQGIVVPSDDLSAEDKVVRNITFVKIK